MSLHKIFSIRFFNKNSMCIFCLLTLAAYPIHLITPATLIGTTNCEAVFGPPVLSTFSDNLNHFFPFVCPDFVDDIRLDDRSSIPGRSKISLTLPHHVQAGSGTNPPSYPVGTGGSFLGS
jgi:hypothetical protein